MKEIKKYSPISKDTWQGRVDDPDDPESYRWHQVVQLIDINDPTQKEKLGDIKDGVAFLGFSCDKGVEKNRGRVGTALGPFSIRRAMSNLPSQFQEKGRLLDAGNIHCLDGNLESAQDDLAMAVKRLLEWGLFPIVLGGGHEIAYGHYKGVKQFLEGSKQDGPAIMNIDAHFDMRPYHDGRNSGTMFRQIADECEQERKPFHYFVAGIQKSGNTRNLFRLADEKGVDYILARDIREANMETIIHGIDNFLERHDPIYLTLCSDVFSAAFAPGVSAPQPFGIEPEIALKLIKHVVATGKVVSFDVAEVSPRFDNDNRTAKLASVIIYAVINKLLEIE